MSVVAFVRRSFSKQSRAAKGVSSTLEQSIQRLMMQSHPWNPRAPSARVEFGLILHCKDFIQRIPEL
jgi:hypothetical protein